MISLICFSLFGMLAGLIVGIIPALGPMVLITLAYSILALSTPVNVMAFYAAVLIAANYTNGVAAIIYGIPGDATSIPTAQYGHRLYRRGFGSYVVGSNAVSGVIGVSVALGIFTLFIDKIFLFFTFYNSIVQAVIVLLVFIGLIFSKKSQWLTTILMVTFGGILSKIGVDKYTLHSFMTFGNEYLNLGIPFMSVMVGLYVFPEFLKKFTLKKSKVRQVAHWGVLPGTFKASMLGSIIGFWCGLIPGVTNILGSYASAVAAKKMYHNKPSMIVSSAEAANNTGALSSLLPLLYLAIPITGSEFLIYNIMIDKGFSFNQDSISQLYPVLLISPFIAILSTLLSWRSYQVITTLVSYYVGKQNVVNAALLLFIVVTMTLVSIVPWWTLLSTITLLIVGFFIRRMDTVPIIYGFFLTHAFYDDFIRVIIILFN